MWHAEEVEKRLVKLAMLLPHVRVLGGGQEGRVGECVDKVNASIMYLGYSHLGYPKGTQRVPVESVSSIMFARACAHACVSCDSELCCSVCLYDRETYCVPVELST